MSSPNGMNCRIPGVVLTRVSANCPAERATRIKLDLEAIRPVFDRITTDPAAMRLWFADLITYSEALTLAGVYVPFTDIGGAVLRMLAATRGITISDADGAELTDRFATMPPHPEVPTALRRLRDHGFRLFTLTDNTLAISGRQLEHGGIIDLFEGRFSVDETVRRHKPVPEAYHSVAAELELDPGDICLVASHVWDTVGAVAAGWQAALILREGNAHSMSDRSRTTSGRTSTRLPTS